MKSIDRLLLLRAARRMEERAEAEYKSSLGVVGVNHEQSKKRRDREVGDAKDIRDFVARATDDALDAGRFRFLMSGQESLGTRAREVYEAMKVEPGTPVKPEEFLRALDAAIARAADAKLSTEG